jgi:predicted methyltransferase
MDMIKDTSTISRNIEKAYHENKYIVNNNKVYQPFYSVNAGYYAQTVYTASRMITHRGRFFHFTGTEVNRIIGIELLNNL